MPKKSIWKKKIKSLNKNERQMLYYWLISIGIKLIIVIGFIIFVIIFLKL